MPRRRRLRRRSFRRTVPRFYLGFPRRLAGLGQAQEFGPVLTQEACEAKIERATHLANPRMLLRFALPALLLGGALTFALIARTDL
jgi:hypothetical protein